MKHVLVMGALGQIGSELLDTLRQQLGESNVIGSDIREDADGSIHVHDCRDGQRTRELITKFNIDTVYHLPALLSATAEAKPQQAWDINMNGVYQTLEVARETGVSVFVPSTIGAFGNSTPKIDTPQDTIMRPTTMYGVSKVAGELLCDYYGLKYQVDVRGVRYPGIISNKVLPGGGTTDYAVEIYYEAIKQKTYTCYLREDTYLDMMYMPDAVKAAIDIMNAPPENLRHRNAFNVSAMSFSPLELTAAIQTHIPEFTIDYDVDPMRQSIADSWPDRMDDSAARDEWGWSPNYDLAAMTADMMKTLTKKLS